MNPLLLTKADGLQVLIDAERLIAVEELGSGGIRVSVAAGNSVMTFTVAETMANIIKAVSEE